MGRTNQNLKTRLLQHHNSISSSLKQNTKPEDFTLALSEHIFNFTNHFILFENVSLISRDQGLKQIFRETIEIKKILFKNNSINRDTGEFGLNSIYDNLLRSNKVNITSPKSYDLCPRNMSDISNEPELKRSKRFASAVVLKKIRANKLYVISLLGINFVYFYSCLLVLMLIMNTVYVFEISS